ncbi:fasciclin domain-containing protein [Mycolicibacterium sp. P1-18]|uniref:fasciclin domain-containing protein n=1 Tax=Mycolicibacterium sp. P1-18 TaxID=2024615 RepID=UPI0011F3AA6E|nr:fasciclin domain-containing protein [Mycolicibacterium sp. P1-18]KAA0100848.1 fasciclin domain-containing protein [Mycolicibacterium sp. P1-18]
MNSTHRKTVAAVGLTAVAILGASACSSEEASSTASSVSSSASSISSSAMSSSSSAPMTAAADPASGLVGSSCAAYAKQVPEGPGSVAGMAKDPVATAASNNPMLTTLTAAVSGKLNPGVNLVDTLNGGEFTVIAPTDDAFAKIDAATLEKLKTDAPLLTSILTYHVIPGQLSPEQVAGKHKTVEGAEVDVTGAGEGLKFDQSGLVCGGVKTANATVYMVDTVMMPPAK